MKSYSPHPLISRMIAEMGTLAADADEFIGFDADFRSTAIELVKQDASTQGITWNQERSGHWMDEAIEGMKAGLLEDLG